MCMNDLMGGVLSSAAQQGGSGGPSSGGNRYGPDNPYPYGQPGYRGGVPPFAAERGMYGGSQDIDPADYNYDDLLIAEAMAQPQNSQWVHGGPDSSQPNSGYNPRYGFSRPPYYSQSSGKVTSSGDTSKKGGSPWGAGAGRSNGPRGG